MNVDAGNSNERECNGAVKSHKEAINPSLRGIQYVIFPDNRMAQVWDFIIILTIFYYAFSIPFGFGISSSYFMLKNRGYYIFTIITNCLFVVDTFLAFFRAYRDKNGRIVYSLKTIGRKYFRSGWFFINILATVPSSTFVYRYAHRLMNEGITMDDFDSPHTNWFRAIEFCKLLRLVRIKKIMQTSELMSIFWERINVEIALTMKFIIMISLISHWIACIWGFIAFQQAGSFGDPLREKVNWISNWYENSYVEGGLNPIGWENYIQRYWLCLFWAVQSTTSIGYGNISPVTTVEFCFANFLMLICGIFWAYIIGSLVDVVQSMGSLSQEYLTRMHEANQMVHDFTMKELPESISGAGYTKPARRVRRFITNQRDTATKHLCLNNASTLADAYPTLSILSPELRRVCALHLTHSLLETVPYLSSKYLSPEEQAGVALQCVTLEFSTAEKFVAHPDLGRGILIFRRGFAMVSRHAPNESLGWQKDLSDQPIDVNEVLVEDDYFKENQLAFHFVCFTKVFFVPRSAIMGVLEKNERAWKECARWRYFIAGLVLYSLNDSQKIIEHV